MNPPNIVNYRLEDGAIPPTKSYPGDAGWDLITSKNISVHPGEVTNVPTGLYVQMPPGFWAHIVSRSSTTRKHGVVVLDGVIDNGYRGEMFAQVYNPTQDVKVIPRGSRLAQLIFHKIYGMSWVESGFLSESNRGSNGFGSTGE